MHVKACFFTTEARINNIFTLPGEEGYGSHGAYIFILPGWPT
jgi:hypothetical protein